MRRLFAFCAAALFLLFNLSQASAQDVPEDIYQWVQSSPRISYYFNKAEMKYAVGADGKADINILEVPVLEQYDWIEIQDVQQKRRWNNEDMTGFGNLWGFAGILHIDLTTHTASYVGESYLDNWWNPITVFISKDVDYLDKMSEKNRDKLFYNAIMDYAAQHKAELMERQKDQIAPAILKAAGLGTDKKKIAPPQKSEKQRTRDLINAYERSKNSR